MRVQRRPRTAAAQDAAQQRNQAEHLPLPGASGRIGRSGPPRAVGEARPRGASGTSGRPGRRHAGVEQLVRAVEEVVQRLGGVALLERAVREPAMYQAVAVLSRRSRRPSQASPTWASVTTSKVRPRAAHAQLRERLEAAAEARRRPPDALGGGLELARGGDQRRRAVGLARVDLESTMASVTYRRGAGIGSTVPPPCAARSSGRRRQPRRRARRTASSMPPSKASP